MPRAAIVQAVNMIAADTTNTDAGSWGRVACPVTGTTYPGPLNMTARVITETVVNSNHGIFGSVSSIVGKEYAVSVFVAVLSRGWLWMQHGGCSGWFDVDNGVVGSVTGGAAELIMEDFAPFYRCTMVAKAVSAVNAFAFASALADLGTNYVGAASAETLAICGPMQVPTNWPGPLVLANGAVNGSSPMRNLIR